MRCRVYKIIDSAICPTPGQPAQSRSKWRISIGEGQEPPRLSHLMYLLFPLAALSLAPSGNFLLLFAGVYGGYLAGGAAVALQTQLSEALRQRAEERETALLAPETLTARFMAGLWTLARLAPAEARRAATLGGGGLLGVALGLLQLLASRFPVCQPFFVKTDSICAPVFEAQLKNDHLSALLRGPAYCEGVFFYRLNALERGCDVSAPLPLTAQIWRASGLGGAGVERESPEKGSVARRVKHLLDHPETLLGDFYFQLDHLRELASAASASEERSRIAQSLNQSSMEPHGSPAAASDARFRL